jgi:hypothetical protein
LNVDWSVQVGVVAASLHDLDVHAGDSGFDCAALLFERRDAVEGAEEPERWNVQVLIVKHVEQFLMHRRMEGV